MKPYILLILIVLCNLTIFAKLDDKWILEAPKNSTIVLKFSGSFFGFQKFSIWDGRRNYTAEIGQFSDGSSTVKGESNWRDNGWAWMQELTLTKISKDGKKTVVELRSGDTNAKLIFNVDTNSVDKLFKEVAFVGSLGQFKQSDYYKQEIVNRFLPKIYKGKLAAIPSDLQLKLIESAKFEVSAIDGEEFKGKYYLILRGNEDIEYNTIQVNQAGRTSRTIENLLNKGLRNLPSVIDVPEIDGIKIETKVFYRDFLREAVSHSDDLSVYITFADLKAYKEADITNQQLIDKSIVLVNGNRVQVSLTQFK